jgi:aerobic-type carbon monoxide dehydrogenase small subunit (CoxS/CutS family)
MSAKQVTVSFTLNNQPITATVPDDLALVDYLQEEQGLSGTRLCCGIGVCKVCTVKAQRAPSSQGQPMLACSTPVALLQGQTITTVEGVGSAASAKCSKPSSIILHFNAAIAPPAL